MNQFKTHIAVIRLSAMGDVAMSVPVINAFVNQYPEVNITVVSKGFLKPLFNTLPNVTFFTADVNNRHKGIVGLYKLFTDLKQTNVTHVADLHDVLRSKIIRSFFYMAGYPVAHIGKGRTEKKALTRVENKVFKPLKTSHQRYAEVFSDLGFSVDISNAPPLTKPDLTPAILKLAGNNFKKWIGIAPFAAFESKTYPLDLMEQVIKKLADEKDYQLFLFGGKTDAPILNNLSQKYKNVICVANKLPDFETELNLIANLDIMLSMDSANAHFAAMYGVKTITLWGSTHPYAGFAPFNQPADYCLLPDLQQYPNLPCSVFGAKTCAGYETAMRSINPNTVVEKIKTTLT